MSFAGDLYLLEASFKGKQLFFFFFCICSFCICFFASAAFGIVLSCFAVLLLSCYYSIVPSYQVIFLIANILPVNTTVDSNEICFCVRVDEYFF